MNETAARKTAAMHRQPEFGVKMTGQFGALFGRIGLMPKHQSIDLRFSADRRADVQSGG